MVDNFADRLLSAIEAKGSPVCVGLDPAYDKLPKGLQRKVKDEVEQTRIVGDFCRTVLEAIAPVVPGVKIQSAYFERYGAAGVDLYERITVRARNLGLVVIGDVKRNDIGPTAQAYATGHLLQARTTSASSDRNPDAVTVNGYFGADGIQPFVDVAEKEGKGVFVLVRTSNPSGAAVQDFADASGKKLYEHMAGIVAGIGDGPGLVGQRGYSCVGAVVGATYPAEARRLRELMPRQIFLVPGYGAQGATAADCAAAFKADGTGAIVNASRSVIYAYADKKYAGMDWKKAVEQAAKDFARDIRDAVKR
ncbi:MAG: orotidine-5'-phosphate decarboxylase [Phycisphaerae bacterium]